MTDSLISTEPAESSIADVVALLQRHRARRDRLQNEAASPDASSRVEAPEDAVTDDRADRPKADTKKVAVSLLIPAHNEEAGIEQTLREARPILDKHCDEYEILVIDDGSADRTAELAAACGATVLRHPYGRGYGYALRSGVLSARHEAIVICDADGTYPLTMLPVLLARYEQGYDLVIGARQGRHYRGSWFKLAARRCLRWLCESASGLPVVDPNSGLRVFRRSAMLPNLAMMCTGFSFTTSQTVSFLLLGRPVAFVPVEYRARLGRTKVRHLADSARTAQYVVQLLVMFNPIKMFTMLAAIPAAVSAALTLGGLLWTLTAGIQQTWPMLMLAGLLANVAVMLFASGCVIFGVRRQRWPDPISGCK